MTAITGEMWYNCSNNNASARVATAGGTSHIQPMEGCKMTDPSVPLKQCSRKDECVNPLGSWLPATTEYFHKRSEIPSGLRSQCKECFKAAYDAEDRAVRGKDYYERNKPIVKAKVRERYYGNHEQSLERLRQSYQANPPDKTEYREEYYRLYPERKQAHTAVHNAVQRGKMPRATTQLCVECGKPATHYHHHNGYDRFHRLDVVPLCALCHGKTRRITECL